MSELEEQFMALKKRSGMLLERYDTERGDYSLLSVKPLELDSKLRTLVHRFKEGSAKHRSNLTGALGSGEQPTLLHFAVRCAVLAVKQQDRSWCEDGLVALGMIDETSIDRRDTALPADLLSCAIAATGAERDRLVDRAMTLARRGMRRTIERARTPRTFEDCMLLEVRGDDGEFGLVRREFAPYEPTLDLTGLALRLASWLNAGRYRAEPVVAEQLPPVWFVEAHQQAAASVLKRARAGILVSGPLRKVQMTDADGQTFWAWVLEMPTVADAALLNEHASAGKPFDDTLTASVTRGPLFAIFVVRSVIAGIAPFETQESLDRLLEEATPLLEATLHR